MSDMIGPLRAHRDLLDLHEKLESTAGLTARWSVAEAYLSALGIDLPIYMYLNPRQADPDPLIFSSMPDSWASHYLSEDLAARDPFFKTCATLVPTPTGVEYLNENAHMLTEGEMAFIREAAETGLRSGVSCTARRANPGAFGGWNFGSSLTRLEFEKLLGDIQPGLHLAGLVMHQYLLDARRADLAQDNAGPILSPREREVLLNLGLGLRTAEIAFKMGIRKVTVDLHLKNARTKLNAATREEALVIAIRRGDVSF